MSYSIELAERAAAKLRRFKPDVFPEVVEQLDRLGKRPRLGTRIPNGPLEGRMAYTFRVARPPGAWTFTVLYLFTPDETKLYVTDFGILRGAPPTLVEADPER